MLRTIYNRVILCAVLILFWAPAVGWAQRVRIEQKPKLIRNGKGTQPFDVTRHIIPLGKIQGGGPPRGGIPALTDPEDISAEEAGRLLEPSDRVLGVFMNGQAKAYPVRILNWHELVNDRVGGRAILVSW
ncbi:MAG: DUF3179 domain-containing protein [Acidobacteria bacterium]|nr:MAG: DUF3179 domain-containing protein [Acidobacteriota bacterium]